MLKLQAAEAVRDPLLADIVYAAKDAHHAWLIHERAKTEAREAGVPLWFYQVQRSLVAPALAASIRGLRRDPAVADRLWTEAQEASGPVRAEAASLVREWGLWPHEAPEEFNLGSDQQLAQALYGPKRVRPCERCGWTGTEHTEFAHTKFEPGKKPGTWIKRRPIQAKSRACPERHTYPGLAVKPYHNEAGNWAVDRASLGKLIVRERGACEQAVRLASLRLVLSEHSKVPEELQVAVRASDQRMPGTLRVGGTASGRLSSGPGPFFEGRNRQNLDHRTRAAGLYVADPGHVLLTLDQSKAESHWLAALAQDPVYLEAHEGPHNSHAYIAWLIWRDRVDFPEDRADWGRFTKQTSFTRVQGLPYSVPEDNLYMYSKKCQHAYPRSLHVPTLAETLQVNRRDAARVAARIHEAIPDTIEWVRWFQAEAASGAIVHLGGRGPVALPPGFEGPAIVLHLDGPRGAGPGLYMWQRAYTDPKAKSTAWDMLANALQFPVALTTSLAFARIWRHWDHKGLRADGGPVALLNHEHDGLTVQVREDRLAELEPELTRLMTVTYRPWGRPLTVEVEAK